MDIFLIIRADCNDGDYHTEISGVDEETLKKLKGIFEKMPKNRRGLIRYETGHLGDDDAPNSEYNFITPEEKNLLYGYLPIGDPDYPGIHTIEKIEIMQLIEKII